MGKQIVLATTSPRRLKLFSLLGLAYLSVPPRYEEENDLPVVPEELVRILAEKKALSIVSDHPHSLILACDTVVAYEGRMLGKPKTKDEAVEMLVRLSDSEHQVISGVCILDVETGKKVTKSITTKMFTYQISAERAKAYVEREDVLGVAGGYDHEHLGAVLISHIEGDFYNSIGFPVAAVSHMLSEFGMDPLSFAAILPK